MVKKKHSFRSRNSSSSSETNPRKRVKRCCRKFVAFMCTQVGVGALIVVYAICGAFSFIAIETQYVDDSSVIVENLRNNCSEELWVKTEALNVFDRKIWENNTEKILKRYQDNITSMIKKGYDGRTPLQIWSFPAALMFCLSVFTMIGYGNMVPRTPWGKGFTVIYATFGIPLYILYFLNMGKVLAKSFKFLYRGLHECTQDTNSDEMESGVRKKIIVPSTACLWVIMFYILTGTVMFANWEKWFYLDSFYFCMTSLCKIGFGDFVPGASIRPIATHPSELNEASESTFNLQKFYETDQQTKLAINFIYMLIGMGLVAMCYNLMREEVKIENFWRLGKRDTNFKVMLGGSADRLCTPSTSAGPFRIFAVTGFQNRVNDIVYCPPIIRQSTQNVEDSTAIVYFGGDVQDFPESMETNRDSRGYMKYNLENSAILLREAFPRSHIIVIRPVRMEFKTFSCFDNFVRGNNAGVPDHTPMNHALQHLEKLLQNLSQRLISIPESEILAQVSAAAAVAAAASVTTATTAISSTDAGTSSNSENSQEMDIDILQVQENVTLDTDGAMVFPCSNDSSNPPQCTNDESSQNANSPSSALPSDVQDQQQVANFNNTTAPNDCHSQNNLLQASFAHQQQQRNPLWWRENLNLDKSKLILIGFSKGCVVLNQFIYEFHYLKTLTPDDSTMIRLLSRIKDMYWLDGGHGGQKNTWITSRSLLETLTRMGMNIHVHLTPYQVQDDRRPWIRKEEKIFTDMLRRLGAPITRRLHYESQTANLMTHFEVLQAFCQHIHDFSQQQQHDQQQLMHNQQHSVNKSGGENSLNEK